MAKHKMGSVRRAWFPNTKSFFVKPIQVSLRSWLKAKALAAIERKSSDNAMPDDPVEALPIWANPDQHAT